MMNITRRKFFFFGLAAGVGLLLPDAKIELSTTELEYYKITKQFQYFNPDGGDLGRGLWGVPYHENNASVGTWLGIPRK